MNQITKPEAITKEGASNMIEKLKSGDVDEKTKLKLLDILHDTIHTLIDDINLLNDSFEKFRWKFDRMIEVATIMRDPRLAYDAIIKEALKQIVEVVDADRGGIIVYNEEKQVLYFYAATGDEEGTLKRHELERGQGIAGYIFDSGVSEIIDDVQLDPRYNRDTEKITKYPSYTMICVPLRNKNGEPIGVLQALNKTSKEGIRLLPLLDGNGNEILDEKTGTPILTSTLKFTKEEEKLAQGLADIVAVTLQNAKYMEERMNYVYMLAGTTEGKDMNTARHLYRVGYYSCSIGEILEELKELKNEDHINQYNTKLRYYGISPEKADILISQYYNNTNNPRSLLEQAAILHDIGKINTPEAVLLKPGKLDKDYELQIMQEHASQTVNMLDGVPRIHPRVKQGAGDHHENFDGTGYPERKNGYDIDIFGRILRIADVYDALLDERPYKQAMDLQKTFNILKEGSGKSFDPDLLNIFLKNPENINKFKGVFINQQIMNYYKDKFLSNIIDKFMTKHLDNFNELVKSIEKRLGIGSLDFSKDLLINYFLKAFIKTHLQKLVLDSIYKNIFSRIEPLIQIDNGTIEYDTKQIQEIISTSFSDHKENFDQYEINRNDFHKYVTFTNFEDVKRQFQEAIKRK